ncbi:MAG: GNAT family N-acetyltransferase [Ignavibacteria bacterium]|nr:GNAT family N-acetyltransferase [Ignavibacteria bacterium]
MKVNIRNIRKQDSDELIRLITELAEFEKLKPPSKQAQKRLLDAVFSRKFGIKVLVAENDRKLIGYAFYFFTFSTFLAKPTLYLEDIYISEKYRRSGTGKKMFRELIKIANNNKCGRLELMVLDWNVNALRFYEKFGAKNLYNWKFYRISF